MIVGASSDKEAMVKIMRKLDEGYVLHQITMCKPGCPVVVHLHFKKA